MNKKLLQIHRNTNHYWESFLSPVITVNCIITLWTNLHILPFSKNVIRLYLLKYFFNWIWIKLNKSFCLFHPVVQALAIICRTTWSCMSSSSALSPSPCTRRRNLSTWSRLASSGSLFLPVTKFTLQMYLYPLTFLLFYHITIMQNFDALYCSRMLDETQVVLTAEVELKWCMTFSILHFVLIRIWKMTFLLHVTSLLFCVFHMAYGKPLMWLVHQQIHVSPPCLITAQK